MRKAFHSMRKILIIFLTTVCGFTSKAQTEKIEIDADYLMVKEASGIKPISVQAEFIGFRNPPSDDANWKPLLYKVSKNEGEDNEVLEKIKAEKAKLRQAAMLNGIPETPREKTTAVPKSPVLGVNFAGQDNSANYTPLDNTIAISDKDTIVAFINSQVGYYTATGTNYYTRQIYNLIGDGTLTNAMCDPKVIWDNTSRRFIFYSQVCDMISSHSKIILGFSKTSNPSNGWYFYKFTGDPLSAGDWWDYPKMAVSTDEVFVTGNLFNEASGNTFDQSVIMQIQKNPCYAGTTPLTHVYSGIANAFTICPAGYGQVGSYGPGILAVSSLTYSGGATNYQFYNITNKIGGTPAPVLNTYSVPITSYSPAGNAPQPGTGITLNTGDCRVLDAFYLKHTIHFVHNMDVGSGYCGFRYCRMDTKTLATGIKNIGNAGTSDYCYPAIASAVNDSVDNSVVIAFHETSPTIYPRACVLAVDQTGALSAPVVVKAGIANINTGAGPDERWGDYTGLCKRFGDPAASLWMAGMYSGAGHYWNQWIAKIGPKNVDVPTVASEQVTSQVYPNPIVDRYTVKFDVPERQNVTINITDMEGRTVVELYNGIVESGENTFSFNKGNLAKGIYSLNIIGTRNNIRNEKIVITGN